MISDVLWITREFLIKDIKNCKTIKDLLIVFIFIPMLIIISLFYCIVGIFYNKYTYTIYLIYI